MVLFVQELPRWLLDLTWSLTGPISAIYYRSPQRWIHASQKLWMCNLDQGRVQKEYPNTERCFRVVEVPEKLEKDFARNLDLIAAKHSVETNPS